MASPTRFPAGVSTQAIGSTLGQFPLPDPTDISLDFEDFFQYVAADFTVTNTTSHQTIGLVVGNGGIISTVGGGSSVTADIGAIQNNPLNFNIATNTITATAPPTQVAWFYTAFKATTAANDQLQVGLTSSNAALTPTDGIYFNKAAGTAAIDFVVRKSSTSTTQAAVATLANNTFLQLAFYYNGKDAIDVFVAGVKVYTQLVLTNLPSAVALATAFGVKAAATAPTTSNLVIDYSLAAQGR